MEFLKKITKKILNRLGVEVPSFHTPEEVARIDQQRGIDYVIRSFKASINSLLINSISWPAKFHCNHWWERLAAKSSRAEADLIMSDFVNELLKLGWKDVTFAKDGHGNLYLTIDC